MKFNLFIFILIFFFFRFAVSRTSSMITLAVVFSCCNNTLYIKKNYTTKLSVLNWSKKKIVFN